MLFTKQNKMPDDFKDKISYDDKKVIEDAVAEAEKHKDSDDKDELEAAVKALNDAIMPIGAKMYEQAAKDEEAKSDDDKKSDKDEPVEGEVVDKEDKK
jgi:molecular chaperone DnaK